MTPLQLAVEECANYYNAGACLGITVDNQPLWTKRPPRCTLHDGKRCWYFETCVLVPEDMPLTSDKRRDQNNEAMALYEENRRNDDGNAGLGEAGMERDGNAGTAGVQAQHPAPIRAGGRFAGRAAPGGDVLLLGRGRGKLAGRAKSDKASSGK